MSGSARARCSLAPFRSPVPARAVFAPQLVIGPRSWLLMGSALATAVALGLLGCKDDPIRRQTSDAGLSLLPDAGPAATPAGSSDGVPAGGAIPGLGLDPEQLLPGLTDAGLLVPGQGEGAAPGGVLPGVSSGFVGQPCSANADCGSAPSFCIASASDGEFGGGGPQGGFCSLPCTSNAECVAADGRSGCNTELGFCLGLCTPGASAASCDLQRPLACVPLAQPTLGVCLPTCTSDAACGPGRFCDLAATGLCQDMPPLGGSVGAPCTRETEGADCAGDICLTFRDPLDGVTPVGSFCSANCTFGRLDGCGFDSVSLATSGGARSAACLQAQDPEGVAGDLGYCFELCDDGSDCVQSASGWVCEPFPDVDTAAQLGRAGRCLPLELSDEPVLPGLPDDGAAAPPEGIPQLPGFPDLLSR